MPHSKNRPGNVEESNEELKQIDRYKCCLCHNYLSYFPIHLSSSGQEICGRCPLSEEVTNIRNNLFEALAETVKFPCCFKTEGCLEEMLPKDVPQHEKTCYYRTVSCPISSCIWLGPRPNYLYHCEDKHVNMFLSNGDFVLDLTTTNEQLNLLSHAQSVFFVARKFNVDTNTLQCAVYHPEFEIAVSRNHLCQLTLKKDSLKISIDFFTTDFEHINYTELNSVTITQGKITIGGIIKDNKLNREKTKVDMLSVLKCSSCFEFVLPPIYQCSNQQVILCSKCKRKHVDVCECMDIYGGRNISLDKIANLLDYPCRNHKSGCTFVDKPAKTEAHETHCQFSTTKCPLNEFEICNWQGLIKEVNSHIETKHQDKISSTGCVPGNVFRNGTIKYTILKFGNNLFRLVYNRINERFYFSVEMIKFVDKSYKYEIEIFGAGSDNNRLIMRRVCAPYLSKKSHIFGNKDKYCVYVNENQVTSASAKTFPIDAFQVKIYTE